MKNSFMTVGELKKLVAELDDDDFDKDGNRMDVGGYLDLIVEDVRL